MEANKKPQAKAGMRLHCKINGSRFRVLASSRQSPVRPKRLSRPFSHQLLPHGQRMKPSWQPLLTMACPCHEGIRRRCNSNPGPFSTGPIAQPTGAFTTRGGALRQPESIQSFVLRLKDGQASLSVVSFLSSLSAIVTYNVGCVRQCPVPWYMHCIPF